MPWITSEEQLHEACVTPHWRSEDEPHTDGDLWACPVCHTVYRLMLGTASFPPKWETSPSYWWSKTKLVYVPEE